MFFRSKENKFLSKITKTKNMSKTNNLIKNSLIVVSGVCVLYTIMNIDMGESSVLAAKCNFMSPEYSECVNKQCEKLELSDKCFEIYKQGEIVPAQTEIKTVEVQAQELEVVKTVTNEVSKPNYGCITLVEKAFEKYLWSVTEPKVRVYSPVPSSKICEISEAENFPVDFLLVAGIAEGHFGTRGAATETLNIFNVGNTDCGDNRKRVDDGCSRFESSWVDSIYTYINLIRNCYFLEGEPISLDTFINRNFIAQRCDVKGLRYMTTVGTQQAYRDILFVINN